MNRATMIRRTAFTLIELMVVVAIIALLVSIMIPAFNSVRTSAKIVATQAVFDSLKLGLESYRGESALGGVYPPSKGDRPGDVLEVQDPLVESQGAAITVSPVSGASLLAYALVGADLLGTPGYIDLNQLGSWWDDTSSVNGLYAIDATTGEPAHTRYPATGGSYVDEATRGTVRRLSALVDAGLAVGGFPNDVAPLRQRFFTDAWGRPILYYRANRGGRVMIEQAGRTPTPGIYDLRDNAYLTGSISAMGLKRPFPGTDFGPGLRPTGKYSDIGLTKYPPLKPEQENVNGRMVNRILTPAYDGHFEQFILDRTVQAQNRPVNPDTYLLISAGPDAVYGTSDDVVNWEQPD